MSIGETIKPGRPNPMAVPIGPVIDKIDVTKGVLSGKNHNAETLAQIAAMKGKLIPAHIWPIKTIWNPTFIFFIKKLKKIKANN